MTSIHKARWRALQTALVPFELRRRLIDQRIGWVLDTFAASNHSKEQSTDMRAAFSSESLISSMFSSVWRSKGAGLAASLVTGNVSSHEYEMSAVLDDASDLKQTF
ncbi:MAG: hypothetical protein NNA30_11145 [Nitrospira sp.]|nr:hypothetical protein [Nitrospira sp.]